MKSIEIPIKSFTSTSVGLAQLCVDDVRKDAGCVVNTYKELVAKIAELAFENPEFVLLFRGQTADYQDQGLSTLAPSIFRVRSGYEGYYSTDVQQRYHQLSLLEGQLYNNILHLPYGERVGRNPLSRWAILQHYELCKTPLLDVTQSALVACSFAFLANTQPKPLHFYFYVLGVPQINGAITISPTADLQIVRLNSVCPPDTLRPHFQEGYLLSTYPNVDSYRVNASFGREEMDCAQRLIAKFRISTSDTFWDASFRSIDNLALYPFETSGLYAQLQQLKAAYPSNV